MALDYDDLVSPVQGTKFAKLRPAQEWVLRQYAEAEHSLEDLAIELPTGAGKTLIALLILDYWRRTDGSKTAILTGNKTLARQVEEEANELHVPIVRFEGTGSAFPPGDLRRYRRGQATAIMNYWVYINQRPAVEPADFLVLDDAQLAEGALQSLYSVQIDARRHRDLFEQLVNLFSGYTDSPVAEDVLKEVDDQFTIPTDLICFPDFLRMRDEVDTLVSQYLAPERGLSTEDLRDLRFRWDRNRTRLS